MSYCRWSSDNFKCDVYCYESISGEYEIHVAGLRHFGHITPIDRSSHERFVETHQQQMADLDKAPRKKIGLQYDGQSFTCADALECADMLREIKAAGYNVPEYAIDALLEEAE